MENIIELEAYCSDRVMLSRSGDTFILNTENMEGDTGEPVLMSVHDLRELHGLLGKIITEETGATFEFVQGHATNEQTQGSEQ